MLPAHGRRLHERGGVEIRGRVRLCGAVRYLVEGPARMGGLCLCRTCQKVSGGAGNLFIGVDAAVFRFTRGEPLAYCSGRDRPDPALLWDMRGAPDSAIAPRAGRGLLIKVGTLDEPGLFAGPQLAVWTSEMEAFHQLPPDVPAFPQFPRPKP